MVILALTPAFVFFVLFILESIRHGEALQRVEELAERNEDLALVNRSLRNAANLLRQENENLRASVEEYTQESWTLRLGHLRSTDIPYETQSN